MSKADKRARKRENQAKARAAQQAAAKKHQRFSAVKRLAGIFAVIAFGVGFFAFINRDDDPKVDTTDSTDVTDSTVVPFDPAKSYAVTITTNKGVIEIELDAANAPIASERFVELVRRGFYDGLTFHRVIDDFMIQGGDPAGDGTGGTGTTVVGEVPTDNYPVGALAAAKGADDPPGTFDSQFFIVTGSGGATLPNDYARFGTVTAGIEVAQAIAKLQAVPDDTPSEPITIESITVAESEPAVTTTIASTAAATTTATTTTVP